MCAEKFGLDSGVEPKETKIFNVRLKPRKHVLLKFLAFDESF